LVTADSQSVPTLVVAPVVAVVGSAAIAAAVVPLVVPAVVGRTLEASPLSARTRTIETLRIAVRYACAAQRESYEWPTSRNEPSTAVCMVCCLATLTSESRRRKGSLWRDQRRRHGPRPGRRPGRRDPGQHLHLSALRPREHPCPRGRSPDRAEVCEPAGLRGRWASRGAQGRTHPATDLPTNASDAFGVTCEQTNGPGIGGGSPGPFASHLLGGA
jgi:hypothetical protein